MYTIATTERSRHFLKAQGEGNMHPKGGILFM